ncbi:uncharacterized protein LOC134289578 [Aedes albopictus]|uniref:RNase H type-1 domain-containing protein n=1 Tax=Aedes albopictus TaxID=7160 RepID=A0ABM1YJA7_AEDAL
MRSTIPTALNWGTEWALVSTAQTQNYTTASRRSARFSRPKQQESSRPSHITAPRDGAVLVVTDSNSAISAIDNIKAKHPFIQGIQAALDAAEHRTVLMWVPGHCGIRGNERADVLAGIGRNSPYLTRKIPADDAKKWVIDTIRQAWANEWWRNRTLFLRKAKPSIEPGEDLPNRRDQIILSRLRTGHTRASHNMAAGNSGFRRQCENYDTPNTVEHFLCVCPALGSDTRSSRRKISGYSLQPSGRRPTGSR